MYEFRNFVKDVKIFLSEGVHSDYAKSLSNKELLNHLKTHADPNDKNSDHYADRKAAAIKELHKRHSSGEHPEISKAHDKVMAFHSESPSPYVKRTVGSITGQQLVKPKTAPVVKQKEEKPKATKSLPTKQKEEPKLDSSIHPAGKYDKEEGDKSNFPDSEKVTKLVHKTQDGKTRHVASIVSNKEGHHIFDTKGKKLSSNYPLKSHNEALLRAMQNDRDSSES